MKIFLILKDIIDEQLLGVMLSCVSPENYEKNLEEIKSLDVPFGFKLNGFITTKPKNGYTHTFTKVKLEIQMNFWVKEKILHQKKWLKLLKNLKIAGATILGGCCETRPSHIEAMARLK